MSRILIVEDNEMSRDMLYRRLMRRGFQVCTAEDGREGIVQAKLQLPDLILMDLNLPEIDGWEATRILKSDSRTAHIPVIALTAHAMTGDKQRALREGCDDFASKPVDFASLLETIQKYLPRNQESNGS
jgi:two-component system cell cycle response regulator DivK